MPLGARERGSNETNGVVKESTWVPHKKLDIRMICSLHIVKVDVIMINKHHSAYGWLVVACSIHRDGSALFFSFVARTANR